MALDACAWMVSIGAACLFLNSIAVGAHNFALAWGPAIGAKIVKYQLAAPLGAVCALLGALLFGDRLAPIYGGYLNTHWTVTQDLPELTLYAMAAWPAVLLVWLVTALWMQIPAVPYLGYAAALAGTALVYPGWKYLNWGLHLSEHPKTYNGMGDVYTPWAVVPVLTTVIVVSIFLAMRTYLMRGEDPFHQTLWCLPALGGAVGIVNVSYILFTLNSSYGWHFNRLPAQGVAVVLSVMGIVGTPVTMCFLPGVLKNAKLAAPIIRPVKQLNLLGLDDETLHSLTAEDPPSGIRGSFYRLYCRLFVHKFDAGISQSESLMYIHTNAEEFDVHAEVCLGTFQLFTCCLLSMGHAAASTQVVANGFAVMLAIYKTGNVSLESPLTSRLRAIAGVGMALGILLAGWRMVPVSGVQLSKMSPFRSFVVTMSMALAPVLIYTLHLDGGLANYANLAAVIMVGMAEGVTHVHWRRVFVISAWCLLSLVPVCLLSAVCLAQGIYPPSTVPIQELVRAGAVIDSAVGNLSASFQLNVTQGSMAHGSLVKYVQQAITIYQQATNTCQWNAPSPPTFVPRPPGPAYT